MSYRHKSSSSSLGRASVFSATATIGPLTAVPVQRPSSFVKQIGNPPLLQFSHDKIQFAVFAQFGARVDELFVLLLCRKRSRKIYAAITVSNFEESLSLVKFEQDLLAENMVILSATQLARKSATTMLNTSACMGLLNALYLPRKQCSFLSYPLADRLDLSCSQKRKKEKRSNHARPCHAPPRLAFRYRTSASTQ